MYKTVAEAEEFIQALLPRVSTADGVDVAICPSFLGAPGDGRLDPRLARRRSYAQNMHYAERGRVHRRGLAADARARSASTASSSGTPSAAQYFGETDRGARS